MPDKGWFSTRTGRFGLVIVTLLLVTLALWLRLKAGSHSLDASLPTLVPTGAALAAQQPAKLPTATPTLDGTSAPDLATPPPQQTPTHPPPTPAFPKAVDEARVEALLAELTLEQKIGQMLMVGLPGASLDQIARRRVVQAGVGGIIFLDRNTLGPDQVAAFTADLQRAATEDGPGLPLFIGWNHEGGPVARTAAGMTHFPSAMAQGAANQPQLVYDVGQAIGSEMRSLGVNMNFAPVLDVNVERANPVIGLRAYGDQPALVAALGQAYIQGQQQTGVIAVAKHFPGHGGVDVDSHFSLPRLMAPLDSLQQIDLPPFEAALSANVGSVMVAHLQIPALEPGGWPASLSSRIVHGLLRQEMGYDGVIMTDDMGMGAVLDHYTLGEATVQAVLAGNDLLLMAESEPFMAGYAEIMRAALLNAVSNGRLSEAQIDDAVRRLIRLKLAYNLGATPSSPILPDGEAHRALARTVGQAAVRLVQDQANLLPLTLPNKHLLLVLPNHMNPGSTTNDGVSLLGEKLRAKGLDVTEIFYLPGAPWSVAQAQTEALAAAATADATVVITWNAFLHYAHDQLVAQETLVQQLLATGHPVVVAFGQLPYDRERVPQVPTQIAMHGQTVGQIEGLVALLLGDNATP